MTRVGLTGGLASGKSHVGKMLEDLGCLLIKADDLGHEVLKPGGAAYDKVVDTFGRGILNPDHTINRKRLAAIVFNDPAQLKRLNAIVHPAVRDLADQRTREYSVFYPKGIVVYEAAILVETGSYKTFDRLIVAVCSEEQQVERAMKRDNCSREEALARLRQQMPLAEKAGYADYIVDTSGSVELTRIQTEKVFQQIRSLES